MKFNIVVINAMGFGLFELNAYLCLKLLNGNHEIIVFSYQKPLNGFSSRCLKPLGKNIQIRLRHTELVFSSSIRLPIKL